MRAGWWKNLYLQVLVAIVAGTRTGAERWLAICNEQRRHSEI